MKTYKLPLFVILIFNILTLVIYIASPFELPNPNNIVTTFYVAFNIAMIAWGFNCGITKALSIKKLHCNLARAFNPTLFNYIFVFYLATFLIRYCYSLYCPLFDIPTLIRRVVVGIMDPQIGRLLKGSRSISWSLYFIVSIVDSLFFVIGLVSWSQLSFLKKLIFVFLAIIEIFYWLGSGTNFGVIILVSSVLFTGIINIKAIYLNVKRILKYTVWSLFLFIICIVVFSHNMEGRAGGDFERVSTEDLAIPNATIDYQNPVLQILPYRWQIFYLYMSSYLAQGYCHLEQTFILDYDWGHFVGNTPALQSFSTSFLGYDPAADSYQKKLEVYGIDSYIHWHSCYTWLANDFTFYGVPLIIFFIAKFAGFALILFRKFDDWLSGIVFLAFANMMIFYFANNNYLSSIFYSFMFVFPAWLFSRYWANH